MATPIYTHLDVQRTITACMRESLWDVAKEIRDCSGPINELFADQAQRVLALPVGTVLLDQACVLEQVDAFDVEEIPGYCRSMAFVRGGLSMLGAVECDNLVYRALNMNLNKRLLRHDRRQAQELCRVEDKSRIENQAKNIIDNSKYALNGLGIDEVLDEIADVLDLDEGSLPYVHAGAGWLVHETVNSVVRRSAILAKKKRHEPKR